MMRLQKRTNVSASASPQHSTLTTSHSMTYSPGSNGVMKRSCSTGSATDSPTSTTSNSSPSGGGGGGSCSPFEHQCTGISSNESSGVGSSDAVVTTAIQSGNSWQLGTAQPCKQQRRRIKHSSTRKTSLSRRRNLLHNGITLIKMFLTPNRGSSLSSSPPASVSAARLTVFLVSSIALCCTGFLVLFSLTHRDQQYHYARRSSTLASYTPLAGNGGRVGPGQGHDLYQTPSFERYSTVAPMCHVMTKDEVTYTLVTQLSYDRLWMLEHHCKRWGSVHGRLMSLAVYTNESVEHVYGLLQNQYNCEVSTILVQTLPILYDEADYPVNELRNLAFSAVTTTHIVYVDVDFWESIDLYETLQHDEIKTALASSHKTALVIPALALKRQCGDHWNQQECPEKSIPLMPQTRDQAIPLVLNRTVTAFDPTNFGGHGSTRYAEWLEQRPSELLPIECVHSNRYEPYLVVRYCYDLPPFQTAFSGYGKNKMSWILQLRREGWSLFQISSFLVHYPHMDSRARLAWNGGEDGHRIARPEGRRDADFWLQYKRGRNDKAFVDFRSWLQNEIPDQGLIPSCTDEMDLDDDAKLWVDHGELDEMKGVKGGKKRTRRRKLSSKRKSGRTQ